MVVGVLKSLEEGRTYTYRDLEKRFGLTDEELTRAIDGLMERGHIAPVVADCLAANAVLPVFERELSWKAIRRAL